MSRQQKITSKRNDKLLVEQERKLISRELHDLLGHSVTNLIIGIDVAIHLLDKDPEEARKYLLSVQDTLRKGLLNVRKTLHSIHDGKIFFIEFLPALKYLLQEVRMNTGVQIIEDFPSEIQKLYSAIEVAIYRLIQEGLTNGIRHGHSTVFHCSIDYQDSSYLCVRLFDNGIGFKHEELKEGYGLRFMHERVKEAGGQLTVTSEINKGTHLMAIFPETIMCSESGVKHESN